MQLKVIEPQTITAAGVATRPPRGDALPEQQDYRDEGCDLFPSCLSCPLPRCRYDVPGGVRTLVNQERDHQIRIMRHEHGLSVAQIADRFQVSRRTVFRALETPSSRSHGSGERHHARGRR